MKRLRMILVCSGLALTVFALAGGPDGIAALAAARSWEEAGMGWVCRIPDSALFGLLGLTLGALLIALSHKA